MFVVLHFSCVDAVKRKMVPMPKSITGQTDFQYGLIFIFPERLSNQLRDKGNKTVYNKKAKTKTKPQSYVLYLPVFICWFGPC